MRTPTPIPLLALLIITLLPAPAFALATRAAAPRQAGFFDGASDPESQAAMKQAAADIEKYRKGDFTLRIVDQNGAPVKNAAVTATLTSHLFDFGTNLFGVTSLKDDNPLKKTARQTILDIFNTVVVVNYWHNPQDAQRAAATRDDIAWARANGLRMRFHAVLYNDPKKLFAGKNLTTPQCWEKIEERLKYVAATSGGNLSEYDVINEMVSKKLEWDKNKPDAFMKQVPGFPDLTDPQTVARVFALARKYLPNTKLVGLEAQIPSLNNRVYMEIIDYWKRCLASGADIDIIGTQCHFFASGMEFQKGHSKYGPDTFTMGKLSKALDALSAIGRPIAITEFSGPSRNRNTDPAKRDKFWSMSEAENSAWQINFYRLAFSKPYIKGITRWFHIDNYCGRAMDAGILTAKGEKHQIYYDLRKLIKEEWNTRAPLATTDEGKAAFRGFYGDYEITAAGYKPTKARFDKNTGEALVTLEKLEKESR